MSDPREALFVMPNGRMGGAERVAFNLAAFLLSCGWRVSLVTMSLGRVVGWDQLDGDPNFNWIAIRAKSEKRGILLATKAIADLCHSRDISVAYSTHVHINAMLAVLRHFGILRTKALVVRESTVIFMRKTKLPHVVFRALYRLYGGIDALICQTTLMKSHLLEAVPRLRNLPVVVVPNPVNIAYITERVADGDVEGDQSPIDFVFCGRIMPLKRPDLVIKALGRLERDSWSSAHFLGAGDNTELRALAFDLGISERIVFRGNVDNPFAVFARSRVGVLASTVEGFPNVLLEMMAAGTGRIVSSLCTPAVLDLPGIDMVDPIDEERLAEALNNALAGETRITQYQAYIRDNRSVDKFWTATMETVCRETKKH